LSSPTANKPLRIGILVDSERVPYWQYNLLEKTLSGSYAELVLTVVRKNDGSGAEASTKPGLGQRLLYKYLNWDRRFKGNVDPFATTDLNGLNASYKTMEVSPETTKWSDRFLKQDVETIKSYDLDVVIRLGFRILRGDILNVAKHGVWSYHHGDNASNRGGPPAFWEIYQRRSRTGLTLQVLSEELDGGMVIAKSITATDKFSVNRTKEGIYWRSTDVLPRKLRELHRDGPDTFFEKVEAENKEAGFYDQPLLSLSNLSTADCLRFVGTNSMQYLRYAIHRKRFEEKWVLYFSLADELSTSMRHFQRLESPDDRYWADPFVVAKNDQFYIFVEEYMYDTRKGRVAVVELDATGKLIGSKTVIDRPYHFSYPSLFEFENELYMVPESAENRTIEVYRCTEFPYVWEPVCNLMEDIAAVDTTIFNKDGKWWMLTSICDNPGGNKNDELFVFSSDSPLSQDWQSHPMNPVVSDVRKGRSGGPVFNYHGSTYRPAQNCSVDYGYAMSVQKIEVLTDTQYSESLVSEVEPDWDADISGVHTLAYTPGITVVDARTYIKKGRIS